MPLDYVAGLPLGLGQYPASGSTSVVLASDQPSIPVSQAAGSVSVVGGKIVVASATFTRQANTTAYAANQVVSNSAAGTVMMALAVGRVNGGSGYITGIRVSTNLKSITPRLRVHLFNDNTATVSADLAAWQEKYADIAKRIFPYDMPAMATGADTTNSDMSRATDSTMRIPFVCGGATQNIYAVFETLDIFTPSSAEQFTLTLSADQN